MPPHAAHAHPQIGNPGLDHAAWLPSAHVRMHMCASPALFATTASQTRMHAYTHTRTRTHTNAHIQRAQRHMHTNTRTQECAPVCPDVPVQANGALAAQPVGSPEAAPLGGSRSATQKQQAMRREASRQDLAQAREQLRRLLFQKERDGKITKVCACARVRSCVHALGCTSAWVFMGLHVCALSCACVCVCVQAEALRLCCDDGDGVVNAIAAALCLHTCARAV